MLFKTLITNSPSTAIVQIVRMVGALVVPIMVVTVVVVPTVVVPTVVVPTVVVPTVVVPTVVTPLLERRVDEPRPARNANTMTIATTTASVWFLISFIPSSGGFTPTL